MARATASLLICLALAACTAADPAPRSAGRASLSALSSATPGDGGPLDAVDARLQLDGAGPDSFADQLLLDADGQPVVLVSSADGVATTVLRPTRTSGWNAVPLSAFGPGVTVTALAGSTPSGTVLFGVVDLHPAVFRIAPDGATTTVRVSGAPADASDTRRALLSPDGGTVFADVGPHGGTGPRTVLAVDAASGAVVAGASAPPGRLLGTAGADLLFLDSGTVSADRTEIDRLTPQLWPDGAVSIEASYVTAVGAADGTVYAGVLAHGAGPFLSSVRLLVARPRSSSARDVWSVPDARLVDTLYDSAVDPSGTWVYVLSQQARPGGSGLAVRVTPIDVASGTAAGSVELCDGYDVGGMVVAPDGSRAFVAARCDDSDVPTLITLR